MKRTMKTWALVAVAAMGLTACQNDFEEQVEAKDSVVVTFVADSADTRTSVDTSGETPLFAWGDDETFAVLEQTDALAEATNVTYARVDGKANITAEFPTNSGKSTYEYVTVYPESGYVSAENIDNVTLALPAEQTMVEGSYDPNADLMVSMVVEATEQPTEAQMVGFHRIAAVVEMSIKNLAIGVNEQIEKVEFMADGKDLAGTITANLNVEKGAAPAPTVSEGVSSVSVATTASDVVYFTVLPTTLNAGDTYSVAVVTDKKAYVKVGTIPESKSLDFQSGMVTRFGVNMADVEGIDKWTLVRDASTLKEGDVVAIVAKDYDKALSTKLYSNASETSTSAKRGVADVVKMGNFLKGGEDLQQLTLMTGVANGTFSFYDEARGKFLVSTTTGSTYLVNQVYCDVNTSFKITIDNATTATITNTEGAYAGNLLRYNSNGYFVSNQNTGTTYKDVCIYRLEGAKGDVPVVAAVVTVPAADKPVVIAEEGAAEATAIDAVVFNYVGPWTISVSDNAEWLEVSYADGQLTYTADVNTGAKRDAVATITASLEGQESLTWSFNLSQKGAPQEISIEEFVDLAKDENSTYKLTGKIVQLASNATTSGYYLADEKGNQAIINYLDTEDGDNVWGHESLTLNIGDVVTVTTVPMGSKKGGNSSNPSIYKGHYGIYASAGVAADYTGGTVTIEVETYSNGTIILPEAAVEATMESDYATLTYDGGDTATVTFTSSNDTSYAREAIVTFTYGLTSVTATAQQGINPANKIGYELVTDASTLAVGDEVIIVAKNADKALGCPTGTSQTTSPAVAIKKSGNVIYDAEEAGVQVLTLGQGVSEGTMSFDFTYNATGYRLHNSSGKLKIRATSYAVNAATSWTININEDDGTVKIFNVYSSSNYYIKFNSATSTTFTLYKEGSANETKADNAVCIYKKQTK